ncbi:MAG TPA: hypothetical protein VME41_04025 [Stellaceae bacterium]|nr:hypothetical protein [Stellaceae bacterium]
MRNPRAACAALMLILAACFIVAGCAADNAGRSDGERQHSGFYGSVEGGFTR